MKGEAKSPILIVCGGGYVSGKEVMTLELGEGLARNGESVCFITSFWNNGDFLNRLKLSGLPTQILARPGPLLVARVCSRSPSIPQSLRLVCAKFELLCLCLAGCGRLAAATGNR